ncbi:MAG: TonB-dependent receptor [Bacteroidota bacterium]
MLRGRSFLIKCLVRLCIFLYSPLLHGQNITYQATEKPLSDILDEISDIYAVYFSYGSSTLIDYKASIQVEDVSLVSFLSQLLTPYGLKAQHSKGPYYYIQSRRRKLILHVRDQATKEPLAFAIVQSLVTPKGAYADARGIAALTYQPDTDSLLLIKHIGYLSRTLKMESQTQDTLWVNLAADQMAIEEVLIEYQNDAIVLKEATQYYLNPQGMKVIPGLAEPDVLSSVQMLPGVESNDETTSGINIRGGGADESLIYWDRIPVYQPAHFFGSLTSFIPSTVQEISTFKNYIPANYTGAISGLLEIRLHDSIPLRPQIVANANLTHADAMMRIPIGQKIGLMIGGRLSYNNELNSPTFRSHQTKLFEGTRQENILESLVDPEGEEEGDDVPTGLSDVQDLSYYDLNGKVIFNVSAQDYLSISGMANADRYFLDIQSEENNPLAEREHNIDFGGINLFYKRIWSRRLRSTLSASQSSYNLLNTDVGIFDEGETRATSTINNSLSNTEIKAAIAFQTSTSSSFQLGYQWNRYQNSVSYEQIDAYEEDISFSQDGRSMAHGLFGQFHFSSGDKIDFQPQLRINYFPELDEVLISPVINCQYKFGRNIWFKASYGHYAQALRTVRDAD